MRNNGPKAAKSERILTYLQGYQAQHGIAPTLREIALSCELSSTSMVNAYLAVLEGEGKIKRYRNISRGIVLLAQPPGAGRNGGGH